MMNIRRNSRQASRLALALAEGVFSHMVDMTLWMVIYMAELSLPQSTYGQVWRAQISADKFLNQINYDVIKNAVITARKQGLLKIVRRGAMPEITKEGKRRLNAIIPSYDEKRIWDKRMHIVTYDIPEQRRIEREMLRRYLRKIGCGRLQDSVWLTPYNPIDTLRAFIFENALSGTIIVSDLGTNGSIGEEDLHALVSRVYALDDLNDRYKEWLEEVYVKEMTEHQFLLEYLSILRDDPQLPFELLPSDWKGSEAYEKVRTKARKLSFSLRSH